MENFKFSLIYLEFINYKSLKLKPQSVRSVMSRFESYILPYFKDKNINDISTSDYLNWQFIIDKKGFSYSYKKTLHYSMVSFYDFLELFHNYNNNIPKKVGNFKNNDIPKKVDYWTYEEFKQFENSFDEQDFIYKVFFILLFHTGLREGEALALTFEDMKNNSLEVNKTISKECYNGQKVIGAPKSKSSFRVVRLDDYTIECLNKLKELYLQQYNSFDESYNIFGGKKRLSLTTINRKKNYYCEKCKLKKIRIHDFRHSHATLLLQKNVPIIEVSRRLGHSDINITIKTYGHLEKEYEKRAINALNSLNNI